MKFESMFRIIHGYEPFPWQSEAASRLVSGELFTSVNVPTASGKTALIDAAIYAAAQGGPRRIMFIIDRRVVVDEAHARAQRVARSLGKEALSEVASRLGPINVVRLRGGVHGDDDWVLYPERTTVIISTVDQVGSRLLHRGYGVSPRMAPLHAGFVGNDALYLIDEAHLSMPFLETVEAARGYGADVRVISMTATPSHKSESILELTAEDRSHPILTKRLHASKIARLVASSEKEDEFAKDTVAEAQKLTGTARVIGIVVNRVGTARRIHQYLVKANHRSELLTGRVRPYDRDRLMQALLPEIRAGRKRGKRDQVFVVATQTIEVGADLDFDALISEAAPLDSLRQRFGRLDRFGELGKSKGAILYRAKHEKSGKRMPDPVYGTRIDETWEWLHEVAKKGEVDFGISAMEDNAKLAKPPAPDPSISPVLLPSHIALLEQTGPDAPQIDVSPWLHGTRSASADISIVWRGDLLPENPDTWVEAIRLRPPLNREALEVPFYAARSWLEELRVQDVTDLEGTQVTPETPNRGSGRLVVRWRGSDECEVIYAGEIRPGDTVAVPTRYGGCDLYGWFPQSKTEVADIADFCSLERQRGHIVRLVPGLTAWLHAAEKPVLDEVTEIIISETEVDPETGVDKDRLEVAHVDLRHLLSTVDHPLINAFKGQYEIERYPVGVALRGRIVDDINASLSSGVAVELDRHLEGVEKLADHLARNHPERTNIRLAARQHDRGKADPRFQAMLHGNPLAAAVGPLLAKSGLRKLSQRLAAYAKSGIPKGFRHELASLSPSLTPGISDEAILVRYLIASHHGYGRPWFPICADHDAPGADQALLGSGWARSLSVLLGQYGPWQLAGMELLLRAADARQSKAEQEMGNV